MLLEDGLMSRQSDKEVELLKAKGEDNRKMLWVIAILIAGGFFLFAGDHVVDEYFEGDCSKSTERIIYNNHEYKCMGRLEHESMVVDPDEVRPLKTKQIR